MFPPSYPERKAGTYLSEPPQFPELFLGPFQVYSHIGSGAMADVWSGIHVEQQVPVAIKVIRARYANEERYIDLFQHEVQTVASLNHPGIATVFEYGFIDDKAHQQSQGLLLANKPYLVMELGAWGTLRELMNSFTSWNQLYTLLMGLLDALSHAHARGVIHRDIKPENILLTSMTDAWPGIVLTDFGLAFNTTPNQESPSPVTACGTPKYIAPEQYNGHIKNFRPSVDLYSFGCIAYEIVCGAPPFQGDNLMEIIHAHYARFPAPVEPRFPIPEGFEKWVLCLLEKDHHNRFQCAADAAWTLSKLNDAHAIKHGSSWRDLLETQFPGLVSETTRNQWVLPNLGPLTEADRATTQLIDVPLQNSPSFSLHPRRSQVGYVGQISNTAQQSLELARKRVPFTGNWRHQIQSQPGIRLIGAGLGLYGLRSIPFIAREAERDRLWASLKEAYTTKTPQGICVYGSTGIGKTALVRWVSQRAVELGAALLLTISLGPHTQWLNELGQLIARYFGCVDLNREELEEFLQRELEYDGVFDPYEWRALSELILPMTDEERARGMQPVIFTRPEQRYALIGRFLQRIARSRPLILQLDDIHWSEESIGLIRYILSATFTDFPIFILSTFNDETLNSRPIEQECIANLFDLEPLIRLKLGPLNDAEQLNLIRELLYIEEELAYQVCKRSAGNPYYAVQIIGDWVKQGALQIADEGFALQENIHTLVPDSIYTFWSNRLADSLEQWPENWIVALELGAALGDIIPYDEWQLLCQANHFELDAKMISYLVEQSVLVAHSFGWSFTHTMLRDTVIRSAKTAGRWQYHHQACAKMMQERYPNDDDIPELLGLHFMEAERYDEAIEPLLKAANFRRKQGHFIAAQYLLTLRDKALERLHTEEFNVAWAKGWNLRAQLYEHRSRPDLYQKWARKSLRIANFARDLETIGHAWIMLAHSHAWRGDYQRAYKMLESVMKFAITARQPHHIAMSLQSLAREDGRRGDLESSIYSLRMAEYHLRKTNKPSLEAKALYEMGYVEMRRNSYDMAESYFNQSLQITKYLGLALGTAECFNALAEIARYRQQFDQAETLYHKALKATTEMGLSSTIVPRVNLGLTLIAREKYTDAKTLLDVCYKDAVAAKRPLIIAPILAALLPCIGMEQNWGLWDIYMEKAEDLIEKHCIYERDIAMCFHKAFDIATRLNQLTRAQRVNLLATIQIENIARAKK